MALSTWQLQCSLQSDLRTSPPSSSLQILMTVHVNPTCLVSQLGMRVSVLAQKHVGYTQLKGVQPGLRTGLWIQLR